MPHKLYVARYADSSVGGSQPNEVFQEVSDLGIRWSVPGGIQKVEFTVRAYSSYDPYRRYKLHLGNTVAIFDEAVDRYIHAQIMEVVPDGRHVSYVCSGAWKRTYDDLYDNTDWITDLTAASSTRGAIKSVLTRAVSVESTDQDNMDAPGVAIGGWSPDISGTPAGDAIKELALAGDVSDNPMDFYFVDGRFFDVQMQAPFPYFKSRSLTADPDWIFSTSDLAPDGLTLARHIWDLKTDVYIGYGRLTGTDDGADNDTLVDGGEDFIADGVRPGDRVINLTDDAIYEVATVATTVLTFTDPATGLWGNGDLYSVRLREPKWTAGSAGSSDYWTVTYKEKRMEMDEVLATQYRDQLTALYIEAQLQQAFVISAPTIRAGNGVEWPLWRAFMGESFYFRIDDLFPEASIFGDSDDRERTFMAVAMDYKYSTNRLRVVPSTGDSRLDSILNQAGLIQGQIVSAETAYRKAKREGAG